MQRNAGISTRKKRTRATSSKTSANGVTVRPYEAFKNGKRYAYWLVQGWQEEGKWQRKRFPVKLKVAGKAGTSMRRLPGERLIALRVAGVRKSLLAIAEKTRS